MDRRMRVRRAKLRGRRRKSHGPPVRNGNDSIRVHGLRLLNPWLLKYFWDERDEQDT